MSALRSVFVGCAGGVLALGLVACSNGEYPSTLPQTSAPLITVYPGAPAITPTPATTRPATTGTATTSAGAAAAATVTFTSADGVTSTLNVTSCTSSAADSATLAATSSTAKLDLKVTAATGTLIYTGQDGPRAGTVSQLQVTDAGALTAAGDFPGAGRPSGTFQLTGTC